MSEDTKERIGVMWEIFKGAGTAVLAAALIGLWVTLNGVTVELARVGERWVAMAERVTDHETRIRVLEMARDG